MRHWNIVLGTFFFRYRNLLFPGVILFAAIVTRPRIMLGSPSLDRILIVSGTAVALGGEVVRLFTIGLDYIHRGGKDSQVYARRLVHGGVYAITRNPMYVGNVLIVIGVTMATGSPLAYVLIIPLFLFVYHTIVLAEEKYLRNKFGGEYDNYCDKVNRFVPPMSGILSLFSGLRYDWKRALRKDLGTITGLIMGLIMIQIWRTYFLQGLAAAEAAAWKALIIAPGVLALYGLLYFLKKRTRLLY